MTSFEMATVKLKVETLFAKERFSICDFDEIGKMLGRNPAQHPNYKFLSALHCIRYCDMPQEITRELEQKVIECLGGQLFNPARVLDAITCEGNDFAATEDRFLLTTDKRKRK